MPTLVLDPAPARLAELLAERRRTGADRFDEVWDGVYHMVPAPSGEHAVVEAQLLARLVPAASAAGLVASGQFNLGESEQDFRVPDAGLHRETPRGTWHPTAALVVEIVSPGDETWEKLPFYARHKVDELLIADPSTRSVTLLALRAGAYAPVERSTLIDLAARELAEQIDWPRQAR